MSNELIKLDKATQMLAEARSLTDVLNIKDIAEAARAYAKAAKKGLEAQNYAAEIKIRAERKAGEMTKQLPISQGKSHPLGAITKSNKLKEIDLTKRQADTFEKSSFEDDKVWISGKETTEAKIKDFLSI